MIAGRTVLAVIPARGGSKGVPGKNLRLLAGKPLVAHAVAAAVECPQVDTVIVSTDSPEIAQAARCAGAMVPFVRPVELATDEARGMEVLLHAMSWMQEHSQRHDMVVLLQPTSPLRTARHVSEALELAVQRNASAVVSVCETEHHPWWSNTLPADGCMAGFLCREAVNRNRQELPTCYRLNGAIFIADWDFILAGGSWFSPTTFAYVMDRASSVDIDTELDLRVAELLLGETASPASPPEANQD